MNLKQVRKELNVWGMFWAFKREGAGYSSNSVTGRLCETLRTGVFSIGTKYQVRDRADEIRVPEHIQVIDDCLHELTASELMYLKLKYINKKRINNLFIDRAEHKLASLL
jgi:hypothetical protein